MNDTAVLDPTTEQTSLGDIPDISLDTELNTDSQPYLGVVVADEYRPNYNKDGHEWHLGVRPVDFVLRGETNCYHARASISLNPSSKMGKMLTAFKAIRGKSPTKIGRGELIGWSAVFINRTLTFNLADGTTRESRIIIPVRLPEPEEATRAAGISLVIGESAAATPDAPAPVASAPTELSDDDIAALVAVVNGKTADEFQMAALSSALPPELMNLILAGRALPLLLDRGAVTVGEDGKVSVPSTPTTAGRRGKKADTADESVAEAALI